MPNFNFRLICKVRLSHQRPDLHFCVLCMYEIRYNGKDTIFRVGTCRRTTAARDLIRMGALVSLALCGPWNSEEGPKVQEPWESW